MQVSSPGPRVDDLNRVSDVYDFGLVATASSLRRALASGQSKRAPLADIALRSFASTFGSDTQGAISLLRRGIAKAAPDGEDGAYLRDILASLLISTGELDAAKQLLGEPTVAPARHAPAFVAGRAVLEAATGERLRSRALSKSALSSARGMDSPLTLGRVLQRCAVACYYRGDYHDARELALEALHVLDPQAAYPLSSSTHSIAAALARESSQDGTLAAVPLCTDAGTRRPYRPRRPPKACARRLLS